MANEIYPGVPVLGRAALALASASPRRRELLGRLVPSDQFRIIAANINEDVREGESADVYVRRLAEEKAEAGANLWAKASPTPEERLVIGADTTVVLDDLLLVCRREFGHAERMVLHFELAHATPIEFVVRLDRDRGQKRDSHQHE